MIETFWNFGDIFILQIRRAVRCQFFGNTILKFFIQEKLFFRKKRFEQGLKSLGNLIHYFFFIFSIILRSSWGCLTQNVTTWNIDMERRHVTADGRVAVFLRTRFFRSSFGKEFHSRPNSRLREDRSSLSADGGVCRFSTVLIIRLHQILAALCFWRLVYLS